MSHVLIRDRANLGFGLALGLDLV